MCKNVEHACGYLRAGISKHSRVRSIILFYVSAYGHRDNAIIIDVSRSKYAHSVFLVYLFPNLDLDLEMDCEVGVA